MVRCKSLSNVPNFFLMSHKWDGCKVGLWRLVFRNFSGEVVSKVIALRFVECNDCA